MHRSRRRASLVSLAALLLLALGLVGAPPGSPAGATGSNDGVTGYPHDDELRLNEIQVVGTHNSYKKFLQPEFEAALEAQFPGLTQFWDYEHRPLPEQFAELGVRQIELDIFADPEGGRYAERNAQAFAGLPLDPGIPELHEPGMKVLHIQEVDVESTCWTLVSCLTELREWSDANPGHVPVFVLVEAKDATIPDPLNLGFVQPIEFDAEQLDAVDAEILSVFDEERIITPDSVRGERETLEEAILTDGWPTLGEVRGKVMFGLDNGGRIQNAYLDGHPSLEGRVMFSSGSAPGNPETAFIKYNNAVGSFDAIQSAIAAGYMVRTRADNDPQQTGDDLFDVRDTALASGAQFVSTDFPEEDPRQDTGYFVQMPGGTPARCNPISAPEWCEPQFIEDPALLAGPPAPACDDTLFSDIPAGHPFCDEITTAVRDGIVQGYDDGTFRPTAAVSRQAMAAFLYRSQVGAAKVDVDEEPEVCDVSGGFSDVDADHPFCAEIMWLAGEGIAQGYDDGTFRPGEPVSRQAAMAFLYRAEDTPKAEPLCAGGDFSDVDADHPFCTEIAWGVGQGIVEGFEDGTFRPLEPVSRQAAVAFLVRATGAEPVPDAPQAG
ncbi:MAG: S-layer homology domain-containing protein [Acidimicrobiia bacterium]|nr:S-layer homology domain-containing protein [Acidimicrobiia bacterium]